MSLVPDPFVIEAIPTVEVTDAKLTEAAHLFSSAYGVWGPLAAVKMGVSAKQGKRVKMTASRLRAQSLAPGTDSVLVRGLAGNQLAGYAFATRWQYDGRQICWVTQLCVRPEHRRKKLATKILRQLNRGEQVSIFGIMSSHPAAISAAMRAWGRGVEYVDLTMAREHAAGILASSPVDYVKTAKLRGSVFGSVEDGTICCADSDFWVDHTEVVAALAEVERKKGTWPFGKLPEGCEFLVLVDASMMSC